MTKSNSTDNADKCCSSSSCCDLPVSRREILQIAGTGAVMATLPLKAEAIAGPFTAKDVKDHLIPADKKLTSKWIASLTNRGAPEVFSGDQLKYVGMPIGGMGCGQLYLGGDGRLWHWDIFKCNYGRETGHGRKISAFTMGGHYAQPVAQGDYYSKDNGTEVQQGFLIRTNVGTKTLDWQSFPNLKFRGEYPVGKVTYAEVDFPVSVELEAFSPFIPLNAKDSAIPATVMSFTVKNTSEESIQVDLGGWLQNATCPYIEEANLGQRKNRVVQENGRISMESTIAAPENEPKREIESKHGFGSMTLTLLHSADDQGLKITAASSLDDPDSPAGLFEQASSLADQGEAAKPLDELLVGGLFAAFELKPGESRTLDFAVTWFFPTYNEQERKARKNFLGITNIENLRRHYAAWFDSASEVAGYLSNNKRRLLDDTRKWNKTWYDSTLPHWLLDRAFIPLDCIATQTFHWFDSGRPYGWEGVDCCAGTCTHVWHYAQALGRVFPEIERAFREKVDFNPQIGFDQKSGQIHYRAENNRKYATDGQAGTILRAYREHQMSADNQFLKGIWPNVKKSVEFIMREDKDRSGLLRGKQPHTLDASWYGPLGWLSGMYLAALAAGEAMAAEMQDEAFASECRTLINRGSENIVKELFDGEYFIHKVDPKVKALNVNQGCHIDQVLGQAWLKQVGLGRVIPKQETISALNSLWKYSFAPDAGKYALDHIEIEQAFRWYAMPGEAGLLMCTWPKGGASEAVPGDKLRTKENPEVYTGPGGYFNECMNGFEYQVAAHMIYEGEPDSDLVRKGLAITKAVHERYAADKRNPYNEIECGDHYARSMASFGVFLAACGFKYHGPKGQLGFAPRINAEDFKAPFITSEGWGTYEQKINGGKLVATIELWHGQLSLEELSLGKLAELSKTNAEVQIDDKPLEADLSMAAESYVLSIAERITISAGQTIRIKLT